MAIPASSVAAAEKTRSPGLLPFPSPRRSGGSCQRSRCCCRRVPFRNLAAKNRWRDCAERIASRRPEETATTSSPLSLQQLPSFSKGTTPDLCHRRRTHSSQDEMERPSQSQLPRINLTVPTRLALLASLLVGGCGRQLLRTVDSIDSIRFVSFRLSPHRRSKCDRLQCPEHYLYCHTFNCCSKYVTRSMYD